VIYIRRVWVPHAECDFYSQSVIFTRSVWFPDAECDFYTLSVISTRSVWFLQAECNFQTQYDFDTHKCDFYTQSVMWHVWVWLWHLYVSKPHSACRNHSFVWFSHASCDEHTHECNFWTQSVISTRTRVISSRRVWSWDVWVWLRHARVWITHARVEFQLDTCDFNSIRVTFGACWIKLKQKPFGETLVFHQNTTE
jgi:hypothetical protein